MFFQLLFIHLFRPFLKYTQQTSPLPHNVSPRKLCTQAAGMISKLIRLYKRSHGLRQICNITVYIAHSACTIHLLNLPEKNARRDIVHGVKHLEEIAEGWLCARRTLNILSVLARKWKVDLPEEAATVLARTDVKYGSYAGEIHSPSEPSRSLEKPRNPSQLTAYAAWQDPVTAPAASGYVNGATVPVSIASRGAPPSSVISAPVPTHSDSYTLPPDDANDLRALQYPSAQVTPASSVQGHRQKRESLGTVTSAASPSDMFGGVEQLIRDSQDWVYRDQAQYALGFENWNANAPMVNGGINGGTVGSAMTGALPLTSVTPTPNNATAWPGTAISNGVPGGFPPNSWLVGLNPYNSVATYYNEDEWYQ